MSRAPTYVGERAQSELREGMRVDVAAVWLTGLPSSGKSTIASLVARSLLARGRAAEVLDGDELRRTVSADLGFSAEDRCEQARRAAVAASRCLAAGGFAIVAVISPLRRARAAARAILGTAFREVYVDAPVGVCEARDTKGMYARARRGALSDFTGVSSPYEPPTAPDLHLDTVVESPTESADRVIAMLVAHRNL